MTCLKDLQVEFNLEKPQERARVREAVLVHARELGYAWFVATRPPRENPHYMVLLTDGSITYSRDKLPAYPVLTVRDFLALESAQALPEDTPSWLRFLYTAHREFGEEALAVWNENKRLVEEVADLRLEMIEEQD